MKKIIIGILLIVILPLIGCSGDTSALEQRIADLESQLASATTVEVVKEDIPQEEYDKVVAELDTANAKIEDLEAEVKSLEEVAPEPTPSPTPPTPTTGYARSNPADIGTELYIEQDKLGDVYKYNITLLEIVRGEEAWGMVEDARSYADPPPSGFEYLVAKIRFEYLEGPTPEESILVYGDMFTAVSSEGKAYENPTMAFDPEPSLHVDLYPGASHEGWAVYTVSVQDDKPLLTFGKLAFGGCTWWQLY